MKNETINFESLLLEAKEQPESLEKWIVSLSRSEQFKISVSNLLMCTTLIFTIGKDEIQGIKLLCALSCEVGRLYGRSELMRELENNDLPRI